MITEIILFSILTYTISSIIVEQKIFEEVRSRIKECSNNSSYIRKKLCQLISCMFCIGFWSGFFISLLGFNIMGLVLSGIANTYITYFFSALLGAFSSYLLYLVVGTLQEVAIKFNLSV